MNIKLLVDLVGMTPYQALKSATRVNAEIVRMEELIGSIECGKLADLVIVDGHPDEDINVILDPAHIQLVMKEGQVLKNLAGNC